MKTTTLRKVPVSELKAKLLEYVREVEKGKSFQITKDGKVVAQLKPEKLNGEETSPSETLNRDDSMKKYSINQAETQLAELIHKALNGENILIGSNDQSLIKLSVVPKPNRAKLFGMYEDQIIISADFDDTPEDFKEYV
jgi:antitoxin (DNA-binding transcriptional repressor) of toxin-antitoxin stability system